jgi:hypothetical protein
MGITKKSNTHLTLVFFLSTTTVSETNQWCAKLLFPIAPHLTPYVSHIFCPKVYICLYVSHILCPNVFFFLLPGLFPSHSWSVETCTIRLSRGMVCSQ